MAKKGPRAADLMKKLLVALGIDADSLERDDPFTMRDLQRLCTTCTDKRQCQFDLTNGIISDNFRDHCSNAFTLDALLKTKQQRITLSGRHRALLSHSTSSCSLI
jgi:hypothetical protein